MECSEWNVVSAVEWSTWRLKGEVSESFSKPRKEYCLSNIVSVAFGRLTANGLSAVTVGTGSAKGQMSSG